MNGIAETSFSPDTSLTRAMLSVILWRIEGCPAAGSPADFTDTNSDDWFADSLSWCVESGAFAGYPDGSFRPDEAVTREQLAVVFYRYAGASAQHSESEAGEVSVTNCCEWAADACTWANAKGLFTNALGTLDLCASASRAEIANLLDQYFKTEGSFESLGYLLYTPSNAKADMPLIVYLHGGHGKGSDLSILTDTDGFPQYLADNLLGDIPAYVLIPQLPADQRG